MAALWVLFWQLVRLRRGPEDIPYSVGLLALVITLDFFASVGGQLLAAPGRLQTAIGLTLLALTAEALVLFGLLRFKRLEARFVQALTGIVGVGLLLGLLAMPLTLLSHAVGPKSPVIGLVVVAQMLIVGWNLALRGFIYHRALNIGMLQGNMLSLALFMATVFLSVKLFPDLIPANG